METQPERDCSSPGPEEFPEEAEGSSNNSLSPNSNVSISPIPTAQMEKATLPPYGRTFPTRKQLPLLLQKEMSKMFSARCDATQTDLIPFKVLMDLIREHYHITNKPEIVRVLIRLLCQYQPLQGEKEYKKLISLCEDLLSSLDEDVREAFISLIPGPAGYRHNAFQSIPPLVCGHMVRDFGGKEEKYNPLSELIKRPLLSYQTMPAPLFQQPFLKPPLGLLSNTSGGGDAHKDPMKYFNFGGPGLGSSNRSSMMSDNCKPNYPLRGQYPGPPPIGPSSWSGHMPHPSSMPLNSNSLMWFRAGPSPLHSPTTRPMVPQMGTLHGPPFVSSMGPSTSAFSQSDLKKHQLLQQKQEIMKNIENLTKLKNFEAPTTSSTSSSHLDGNATSNPSGAPNFLPPWLSMPNYCNLRSNISAFAEYTKHLHAASKEANAARQGQRFDRGDGVFLDGGPQGTRSEGADTNESPSSSSYFLNQLLKRPETPDCSDQWAAAKKTKKQKAGPSTSAGASKKKIKKPKK